LRILLLNQNFHPDVMATGQYLTELAVRLVERGHQVIVVTSRRGYDQPEILFPKRETWRGVEIHRVGSTGFGKTARWRRAADFASFNLACCLRLVRLPRPDAVVALTSPPLISFIGAWLAKLRGARFYYWVMDFNPDEAIAAGWLRPGSVTAKVLERMSRFSLQQATKVIVLDRFMGDRVTAKGIAPGKVAVIPMWSHDEEVRFDTAGRERFRNAHGLAGKFVVMHSGNHSPCHPLDTLMQAAEQLRGDGAIRFCFVGGGSEFGRVRRWAEERRLDNVLCVPYQPLDQLSASLSAADLHVVLLGNPFVGLLHPCKIYNILGVAAPVLYIGPEPSHLSEILRDIGGQHPCAAAQHGEVDLVVQHIRRLREHTVDRPRRPLGEVAARFSKEALLPRLVAELESAAPGRGA
jgi:colanic acid biosynthesis glycosyl transferase WcaI